MMSNIMLIAACKRNHPQTKFAKFMFSQVSVCPGGGGHAWLMPPAMDTPPVTHAPLPCTPHTTHAPHDMRSMSRRYASYWNAFLFLAALIVPIFRATFSESTLVYSNGQCWVQDFWDGEWGRVRLTHGRARLNFYCNYLPTPKKTWNKEKECHALKDGVVSLVY